MADVILKGFRVSGERCGHKKNNRQKSPNNYRHIRRLLVTKRLTTSELHVIRSVKDICYQTFSLIHRQLRYLYEINTSSGLKQLKENAIFRFVGNPTCLDRMATRNPSLGLTHHTYNRLQAGCYLTHRFIFQRTIASRVRRSIINNNESVMALLPCERVMSCCLASL
jgi:hypothetical protein